jgi:hypothetical protein
MRLPLLLAPVLLLAASTSSLAGGTPEQEAACRPDVRRYCHQVDPGSTDSAYLACLQEHREQLSAKCRHVLQSNGV